MGINNERLIRNNRPEQAFEVLSKKKSLEIPE